mmetsp:Transcript_11159/g.13173  ORF Transcript_11159/g.13173 Transcript_11159/m.13173 type:complete len:155 (-) Transcript_11159:149-613(-)
MRRFDKRLALGGLSLLFLLLQLGNLFRFFLYFAFFARRHLAKVFFLGCCLLRLLLLGFRRACSWLCSFLALEQLFDFLLDYAQQASSLETLSKPFKLCFKSQIFLCQHYRILDLTKFLLLDLWLSGSFGLLLCRLLLFLRWNFCLIFRSLGRCG